MKISRFGIEFIKMHEGLRLKSYKCEAGINTIGFGHIHNVLDNQCISLEDAERFLTNDLAPVETMLNKEVNISLRQNHYDALCSMVFNCGVDAIKESTLLRKLNDGDIGGAALEILRWNHAGGKVSDGLTKRRHDEYMLFLFGPDPKEHAFDVV